MRLSSTVILKKGGEVLLIERATEPFKGYWALVGGAKKDTESFIDCAIREVFEEVGISLRCITRVDEIMVENDLGQQFSEVYVGEIMDTSQIKLGGEVTSAELFNHKNLPSPIVPFHKEAIERYFAR